ncbi:hypothetical protein [Exiguobacterium sp. s142]|uniref:hypothetical protein n=1 Tax=Exiguobacterium sp. s142 TaxID=2751222 RepID=UPI001BE65457|nr:hypothetical protein [Exiguobacterium sp. s142]
MKVNLTHDQELMKAEIKKLFDEAMKFFSLERSNIPYERLDEIMNQMSSLSHKLHMQLEPKPKHHKYMINNRGLSPEDPNFYDHVHTVEDLLKYLDDSSANDDPEDVTLDITFEMNIYSRRWGHKDLLKVTRNKEGWFVSRLSQKGQGGLDAEPILSYVLKHDSISFPHNLSNIMEDIWIRAEEEGLSKTEVQKMLTKVADWINMVEMNYPENIAR